MQLRVFWRSLIAAAAIAILFGGPAAQAQTSGTTTQASAGKPLALGKYVKKRPRHARKAATRHSRHSTRKSAKKSNASQRSARTKSADNAGKKKDEKERTTTASVRKAAEELSAVADARAEMKADDLSNSSLVKSATSENTNAGIGTADTLTDLDKAAAAASALDSPIAAPTAAAPVRMVSAAPEPAVPPISNETVSSRDDVGDTWDRTSLIGKIFVAFGGLLTLASAARMFMA